ncbi:hypothetical protein HPP92_012740 [Vanilla planifolia]|uniref:MYB transcription factor n=1 Tax=Vanilla planifolia TaxID=51239 RepID=A0A835UU64_VANPL|nr:hypothetical protein HPP92_012740 [Vanilla planifolia]
MALPGIVVSTVPIEAGTGVSTTNTTTASSCSDDPSKKIRKPYTISKSRENWTEQEHDRFLEALQLFDRDWKKIEAFVGSKTVIQIRSHAQKYFLKVQKNGTGEHVPPPRPKRKAAHPYPQKAPKHDASAAIRKSATTLPSSCTYGCSQSVTTSLLLKEEMGVPGVTLAGNCSTSGIKNANGTWQTSEITEQGDQEQLLYVMPDFARVYSFLGSIFDPSTSGHLQKLKEMDPIDVETVLLLMKNLAVNLISSDFENHRTLLTNAVEATSNEVKSVAAPLQVGKVVNVPFMIKSA